jgi:hypothetical protein
LAADAPCCNDATGSCCMTMQEMMTAGGCFLGGGGGGGGGGEPGGVGAVGGLGYTHVFDSYNDSDAREVPCSYAGYDIPPHAAMEERVLDALLTFKAFTAPARVPAAHRPVVVVIDLNFWLPGFGSKTGGLPKAQWEALVRRLVLTLTSRAGVAKSCVVLKTQMDVVPR